MIATPPEPDPANTPDLEPGGGVAPGRTPPDAAQTSGLSSPEPSPAGKFPLMGIGTVIAIGVIVLVFVVVAVAILV
ncbi:DUF6480 family protein [Rhodococcus erythropolis]|uniref:DUF6480 family protein n=1 Tax=Rhodococcus TaxID=1827 RepID=UPI0009BAFA99|nr:MULTISPECIES: DUF6480 family protein [Rhodococcus]MBX9152065.1 hypothetical protein [Rhodococcus qingshengii]MCQ4127554.1 DUF6480 family protein [Rhodococcus erythropolis]OQM78771.1 hypothetical protein B0E55_05227 [Rhodococcus sp. 66b]